MYVLIPLLFKEAPLLSLQGKKASDGKLTERYRDESISIQGKLFSLWDQYEADELTASQLLKECGHLVFNL